MRRSVPVLGAALTVLALAVPPAWGQSATDSTATGQVGSTDISAPVRVASDGDNQAAPSGPAAGNQSVDSSSGALQGADVQADAPVRVLSDGDDATSGGGAGGSQTADDSTAAGQLGSQSVSAPVRVLSDGGDQPDGAGSGPSEGDQPEDGNASEPADAVYEVVATTGGIGRLVGRGAAAATNATGVEAVESGAAPVTAALRFAAASAAGLRSAVSSTEDSSSPGGGTTGTPGGLREPPGAGDLTALDVGSGGTGLPSGAGVRPAALSAAGTLPLTGLSSWLLLAAGAWLLGAGLALLFTLSWFKAGRRLDARLPHPLSGRRFVR